jgi:predicted amidohydrolase YtcJ
MRVKTGLRILNQRRALSQIEQADKYGADYHWDTIRSPEILTVTRILLLLPVLFLTAACDETKDRQHDDETAGVIVDRLYTNGVIWTGVAGARDASVLGLREGVIVYVGDGTDVEFGEAPATDLDGRFVMPGFIDNHVHFFSGGAALASVDLRDAATRDVFVTRIADYAAKLPSGRWVLNGNWDHTLWGGELPHRDWIDANTGDTPVFVTRLDGHMGLANSAALVLAGVTAATEAPAGGEIVHDETGEPTGILKDNAMNLVFAAIPEPTSAEMLDMFSLAQDHALSLGLTQVHAVTANPSEWSRLEHLRTARRDGLMKIRVHAYLPLAHWETMTNVVGEAGHGDELLRWGGLKGFVDGSLGSATAWFHQPFIDDPDNSGFPLADPAELESLVRNADTAGRRLAIHAIGDRAIDRLIDIFESTAGDDIADRRYRIEHFQHPDEDAIRRAAASGIIASMQPYHAIDDGRWLEKVIGPERARTTYAFRSILDAGGILTFGSDWPVAPLSPLEGIHAAVTRRTPDGANPNGWQPQEKLTVDEALTAYTRMNAYAVFEDHVGGTLELGKRADLVVLSADPRAVDPEAIRGIEVLETVIDGVTVYARN